MDKFAAIFEFVKARKWLVLLAGLFVVPYFAYQNMKVRTGEQPLQDSPEFKLVTYATGDVIVHYVNGSSFPADGLGILPLTYAEYKKRANDLPPWLQNVGEESFPIVIFCNVSGFDATGLPSVIRRVSDGVPLYQDPGKTFYKRVAWAMPLPGNRFKVMHKDKTVEIVSEEEWYRGYMGLAPIIKDEKPQEAKTELKTGLRGRVFKVGTLSIGEPLSLPIKIYAGKIEPFLKDEDASAKVAFAGTTAKDGSFSATLPPGIYTAVVAYEGQLRGNAVSQKAWPSIEVKDGFTDYEFRVHP